MKPILLSGNPPGASASLEAKVDWLLTFAKEVIRNSKTDAMVVSDSYTLTNVPATPVRTLNISTATAAQTAAVFGQFLEDLKKRGVKNGS